MALEMSQEELLNFAIENGMIDLAQVQDKITMQKRQEILQVHPYKIWKGKDNRWRSYLPDDAKGRKLICKSTKESIIDTIVAYWENMTEKEEICTFEKMFNEYTDFQRYEVGVKNNTYVKYMSDYKRFFDDTQFAETDVCKLDCEDIRAFLTKRTRQLGINKKAFKAMYGYINSVLFYSFTKRIIKENPMVFLRASLFFKYCEEKITPKEKRVVSNQQMKLLEFKLESDFKSKPFYIPNYAVKMAGYTGMRVGELSALRWSQIHDGIIEINVSEKYDRILKTYSIESVKTGKERYLPLTKDIIDLLRTIEKIQKIQNIDSEFVFADKNGRVHAPVITKCANHKSEQANIGTKSIHSLRRTVNSNLRCMGVPTTVAASMLGHTEEVNENNYTYDVTEIAERRSLLEQVNANMFKCNQM